MMLSVIFLMKHDLQLFPPLSDIFNSRWDRFVVFRLENNTRRYVYFDIAIGTHSNVLQIGFVMNSSFLKIGNDTF